MSSHAMALLVTFTVPDLTYLCWSVSDEDDALYEKLSGEQWRLDCLMELLAQLKDSDVPGAFFLDLLQVQTQVYCLQTPEHMPNNILQGYVF